MACYGCARLGVAKANGRNEIYDHHEHIFVENGRQQSTAGVRFVKRNILMKKMPLLLAAIIPIAILRITFFMRMFLSKHLHNS